MEQNNGRTALLGGYSTPDGFRHAIVGTRGGELHEVFFNPQKGEGVARLACFDAISSLDSFFTSDDGFQHPIVATPDGNVHEVFFRPGDISFTQPPLAHFDGIADIAAFQALDDSNRIVIVATADGNLTEVFYGPAIGVHVTHPPLARFDGIISIAAFYTADDTTRHVIVATADGNLTEVFYSPAIGVHVTQPPLAHFDGIVDVAAFQALDDSNRIVIVATADGNLTEVFYSPAIGVHVTQPPLARFDNIISIAAFYTADDTTRHVIVATADGNLTELFYSPAIGVHVTQPPLAHFDPPSAVLEDISPDPANVDAPTLAGLGGTSSAGRAIGVVGGATALYAMTERSGVWRSTNGEPWAQLQGSPSRAALEGPQIAVAPGDVDHVVAGNAQGAWESRDRGTTWDFVFDPATHGCGDHQVLAVAFTRAGGLVIGASCGIARRAATGTPFSFSATPGAVRAFAASETKVWARTERALLVSVDDGQTWSAPIPVPASVVIDFRSTFSLAAFDSFAYLPFSTGPGAVQPPREPCGADVKLLVFSAATGGWAVEDVDVGGFHVCDGTGLGGRKFVQSFQRNDPQLPATVGERLQLFYGVGQEVYQADGLNADGTVTSWTEIAATFESGGPNAEIHADIWDFNIDTAPGGRTACVACDGGVFANTLAAPYHFPPAGWALRADGLHTHQAHTLTVLPTTPVGRSRLAYPTADNQAWCRDSTPIVLPAAEWQAVAAGGDVNFSVGDASLPRYVLLARHRAAGTLKHFGGQDVAVTLVNYKNQRLSPTQVITLPTIGPDGPTTFQFIQAPKGSGSPTLDAVMLVDLPLTSWDGNNNVPFDPGSPLGQSSRGLPVLIRNRDFAASPDINTSGGAGWTVELSALPAGTQGFYVTGTPAQPVYFAYSDDGSGLVLSRWNGTVWLPLGVSAVTSSPGFGPAFVNPYNPQLLFVITTTGIQVSTDGADSFTLDTQLTNLVTGAQGAQTADLAHLAFNYYNPRQIAAVTTWGGVFFNNGDGRWTDLTSFLPTPPAPLVAVGIDNESIYVATDGRSLVRIDGYEAAP